MIYSTSNNNKRVSLQDALELIQSTQVNYSSATLNELQYAGGSCVKIGMDTYELIPEAWSTLCSYFNIPKDLLERLGPGLGKLVLRSLNNTGRQAKGVPEQFRYSYNQKYQIISIAPETLVSLSNEEIVTIIKEAIPSKIMSETLYANLYLTETEFEFDCYSKEINVEPILGDILYGGISIRHSHTGTSPTVVLGYFQRLVCTNGMTQRVCIAGKPARTKRCKAKNPKEPVIDAIRDQIIHAWTQLDERLDGIKDLVNHKLQINEIPELLRRKWSLNKKVADEINYAIQHDELERTYSEYDLVNALSRVATHSNNLASRYQKHLSLAAGMLAQRHIHQCKTCGSWLTGSIEN